MRLPALILTVFLALFQAGAPADPVAALQKKVTAGQVKLEYDAKHGYLNALLKNFDIPVSSQTLVFAKNSFQLHLISPENPRAIYFNDDTYVSWTKGGAELEITATDGKADPVFYTLEQTRTSAPKFKREPDVNCLACHDFMTSATPLPRLLMLSVLPNPEGNAVGAASLVTNDQSPFEERWGGWYVTGTHGKQRHLGNKIFREPASKKINLKEYVKTADLSDGLNLTDLKRGVDTTPFLTPHSDIVALMVLGHQTHVHNLMTLAAHTGGNSVMESLVKAMLFSDATVFTDPIKGTSPFAEEFSKRGPRDSRGRSLYELDLQTRLLRYPLTYLIYSKSFDAMPATVKDYVYKRLREVLSGQDQSASFAHLSSADRQAILEILKETKPGI